MKKLINILILLFVSLNLSAQDTYKNPIALTFDNYGIGDPSTFKWMGKYYLISSNGGLDRGMNMWQSEDLVNWTHMGSILAEDGDYWAPEIIYYEGTFYLYTSAPDGNGNFNIRAFKYELPLNEKAKTPLGAFTKISDNFIPGEVFDIDPSPFRDDNGDLYLFWSSQNEGINFKKLAGPEDGISNSVVTLPSCKTQVVTEWTEGPTVHKINGQYYMTYCGNDVLSANYTISKAKGSSLVGLTETANVFVRSNTGEWTGTGHNHWILGPDLQTYYTTYHVKRGEGTVDGAKLHRRLMLDKIWVDASGNLQTSAPTFTEQSIPELPDWSDDFNRSDIGSNWYSWDFEGTTAHGLWGNLLLWQDSKGQGGPNWFAKTISSQTTGDDFVIEFNMKLMDVGSAAVNSWPKAGVFVCQNTVDGNDDHDILYVALNPGTHQDGIPRIGTLIGENGGGANWQGDEVALTGTDFTKWHTIRIEKRGTEVKIFYDNMLKITKTGVSLSGGHFGFITENAKADYGWVGFSNID